MSVYIQHTKHWVAIHVVKVHRNDMYYLAPYAIIGLNTLWLFANNYSLYFSILFIWSETMRSPCYWHAQHYINYISPVSHLFIK